ncbi:MAG: phosphoribosylformylglycinamidine cyclo-ligase [Cyanobacteriota bacterium]|nr:phosphoribosylformylglycinamidine cyclo-ligase [Cyanobacteriota bacterium]
MDYRDAGVDIAAGRAFVDRIQKSVESTHRPGVLGALGGFGGCFQLPSGYEEPILVSGTDGVGTKLKIARSLNRHDTVGIDLVAMCVNDVLTVGAEPLFFLDYLATGHLDPEPLSEVVAGIAEGCRQSGCALLGGETAEMPGFYPGGEYDLAGFCVGIVEKRDLLDGSRVEVGDVIVGLASRGLHSNGFSLARKIVEDSGLDWSATPAALGGKSLGEELLTPTQIYVKPVLEILRSRPDMIRGMAHITGGGLPENLPRCLNRGQSVQLYPDSWEIPSIFHWLAEQGNVSETAMFETFNMGIGFAVVVEGDRADETIAAFRDRGLKGYAIGTVTSVV